jgi:hypothetical protein
MKLPNGDRAIVDLEKLRAYCLNPQHPRGRHKARVFASFGIREADAKERLRPQGQNGQNPQYLDCANRGRLTAFNELFMYYEEGG